MYREQWFFLCSCSTGAKIKYQTSGNVLQNRWAVVCKNNSRDIWAASCEKVPNGLSHCHTKRRAGTVWHRLFRFYFFEKSVSYQKSFFWYDNDSGHQRHFRVPLHICQITKRKIGGQPPHQAFVLYDMTPSECKVAPFVTSLHRLWYLSW